MPALILLFGTFLMKQLPSMMGVLFRMPLWLAGVSLAVGTFVAAGVVTDAAFSALNGVIMAYPSAWCIATGFGVDLALYWFIQSLMAAIGIVVFVVIKQPLLDATAQIGKAML